MVIVGANGLASKPTAARRQSGHVDIGRYGCSPSTLEQRPLRHRQRSRIAVIEYRAHDEYLGDRPISLFYAESPAGPWQVISRGIRNQGRFVWPSNPNLPPTIYLKMETVDLAGNVTTSTLDIPIQVEGIAPRGRIQGFRPLNRPVTDSSPGFKIPKSQSPTLRRFSPLILTKSVFPPRLYPFAIAYLTKEVSSACNLRNRTPVGG